jgi:hypothetical protein
MEVKETFSFPDRKTTVAATGANDKQYLFTILCIELG